MRRVVFALSVFLTLAIGLEGQVFNSFRITHGPWLQNATETGMTVMWTTSSPAVPGVMISTDGIKYRLVQNSTDGMVNAGDTLHKVRLSGLSPSTRYYYRVYSRSFDVFEPYRITYADTLITPTASFVTPSASSKSVSFIVLNDVHENAGKMAGYINSRSLANPDLWFFNGDMIDYLQNHNQIFNGFLDTAVYYFAQSTPFVYVRGNHEARGRYARYFKDYFDFSDDRFFGSFKIGPVQFLVLDCGEDKPDDNQYYFQLADYDNYRMKQLDWLKREVLRSDFREAPFRVVVIHMPVVLGADQWHGMKFLSDHFGPVLRDAGIDLMISGHTHRMAILEPREAGFGYPVVVASNNNFIEATSDGRKLVVVVRDTSGAEVLRRDFNRK
jgi:acid phosphatase type 7